MSIKHILNSAHTMTVTYVISLTLITSLSLLVYFSLDNIIVNQSTASNPISVYVPQIDVENSKKSDTLRASQRLIFIVIVLSVFIFGIVIIRTFLTSSAKNTKSSLQEANHDYLTNLLNRRSFELLAQQAVAISERYKSDLSIVSLDIDHFKSINEQYGQALGDKVIQNVANVIQKNCRDSDSVFRFDGEAFLILLPQTSIADATKFADKVRNKIASAPTFSDKLIIEITVSGGVAQWQKAEITLESALKRADKGLVQAKQQGRDRIINIS
ncbi:GGDEF domain-containing protein [Paraglaciecola arctica]|uniref:GGDEF domain-containing protein n=1 Tax=Paraglaciecola arctica TaxID=1128911 RepID=UPI000587D359|nr:GGDEF domain-containing protein [Paraglaciecola arctica]